MNKLISTLILVTISLMAFSQNGQVTTTTGTAENVYYKDGKVGIGTSTPVGSFEIANSLGATLSLSTNGLNGSAALPLRPSINFLGYKDGNKARITATEQTYNTYGSKLSFLVNDGSSATNLEECLTILQHGYVGIGVTTPARKLDVNGGLKLHDADVPTWDLGFGANNDPVRFLSVDAINSVLVNDPLELVYSRGSGVIIGCKDHTAKYLIVHGNIEAKEIKVTNQPGADFVFEADYKLRQLDEVESFIKEYKHLPEIPSADEMEKNGVNQSKMNQQLLQKIEELTLYMIEQNKMMKEMQAIIKRNNLK